MATSPQAVEFAAPKEASASRFARWKLIGGVGLGVAVVIALAVGISVNGNKHATGALCRHDPSAVADTWVSNTAIMCQGQYWTVSGRVTFIQNSWEDTVSVSVNLMGLPPNTMHGFHVHTVGATSNNCTDAGLHFNPYGMAHGGEFNVTRHVGDLGNIVTDSSGNVDIYFTDVPGPEGISLVNATRNIVNRTLVVHCNPDDYGAGSSVFPFTSNTTGNAGSRTACAFIASAPTVC